MLCETVLAMPAQVRGVAVTALMKVLSNKKIFYSYMVQYLKHISRNSKFCVSSIVTVTRISIELKLECERFCVDRKSVV